MDRRAITAARSRGVVGVTRWMSLKSRAAARVDDPHIIPVYQADEVGGVLFIAMRFVPGGDLRRVLDTEGPLRPERAVEFISPVASALDAAAGLVHRDVKPANILVDARAGRPDHVYLSDFGIAKAVLASVNLTEPGSRLGTPDYSAPEHIEGMTVDGRADQYALACVAYQLLTGVLPFGRDHAMQAMWAHMHAPVPSLAERRPDLPVAAGVVIARGMAKAPGQRYASCGEFADALREALALAPYSPGEPAAQAAPAVPAPPSVPTGLSMTAPPSVTGPEPGTTRRGRRTRRRWPLVLSASGIIAVAAATTAYLTLSDGPATTAKPVATGGAQVGVLASPGGYELFYTAFSRDGATIAGVGGRDGDKSTTRISLWNTASQKLAGYLTNANAAGFGGWPGGLAFSGTGKTLISGDYDGFIHLWDVATRRAALYGDPDNTDSQSTSILGTDYSAEGDFIAEGNNLSNVHLLRLADHRWTDTFKDPTAVNEFNHPGG